MKSKKKTKLYVAASAAAAIAAACILINQDKGEPVTVSRPHTGRITEKIPANGKIRPAREIIISPDVSGEIVELNVEEGDTVCKGDLIIKIRQDIYLSLKDRAEASLDAAKAQFRQYHASFAKAEQDHARNTGLYGKGIISLQEFQASEAEYEVAREQLNAAGHNIKSAEAALDEASENLTKTVIYSPMDGTVSSLCVEKGERVVGTSQMAGTEMMRIADFRMMEVLAEVNENDIVRISENDTAYIEVDAYRGRTFLGTVNRIASSAKNRPGAASLGDVTNFEVSISILPESYRDISGTGSPPFRPGMSASVEIVTSVRDGILTVPLQAVSPEGTVFLYDSMTSSVSPVKVKTGIQDLENIEITCGITDSAWIVTGPYGTVSKILKDGMKVDAEIKHIAESHE